VFLGYAGAAGQALLDVRLYLPRSWVADRAGVRPPISSSRPSRSWRCRWSPRRCVRVSPPPPPLRPGHQHI